MLLKPPVRLTAALASLEGNNDFEEVCKWLEESLADIRRQNDVTRDEVQTRWHQGASQVLDEFLEKKQSARDTLYKMK
jgi:3-oxoacyl-[acyl-carrier-protein] synthase III